MTTEQAQALRTIAGIIVDAVRAAGALGAPGGHIYAALMAHGCSLHQYQQIMSGLVRAGVLRQSGDCYFISAKGKA